MLFPVGQNQERLWSRRHLALKMKDTDGRSSVTGDNIHSGWTVGVSREVKEMKTHEVS